MTTVDLTATAPPSGWVTDFRRSLSAYRVQFAIIGVFVLFTAVVAAIHGRNYLGATVLEYVRSWLMLAAVAAAAMLLMRLLVEARRERSGRFPAGAEEVLLDFWRPEVAAGLALYVALAAFMGAFTTLKTLLPSLNPFWADPWLAQLDRTVHLGRDPWVLLHPLLGRPPVTRLIEIVYGPVWIEITTLLPLFFCVWRRDLDLRRRFLTAFLLTWIVNGCVLAGLFMSGGPAFYGDLTHDHARYDGLIRYLTSQENWAFSAASEQRELWRMYVAGSSRIGAGISAFPSLHVSLIVLCCLAMWRVNRPAAWLLIGVAAIIVVGSVHLGWHYAVGDYAVLGLICGIWWVSGRLVGVKAGRPTVRSRPRQ